MSDFVIDVKSIRERAHKHVEEGAVTGGNKADRKRVIDVLNDALATELVCILRGCSRGDPLYSSPSRFRNAFRPQSQCARQNRQAKAKRICAFTGSGHTQFAGRCHGVVRLPDMQQPDI